MKTGFYAFLMTLVFLAGCRSTPRRKSSPQTGYNFAKVEKVAIVSVEGAISGEAARDQIAEFFAIELLDHGYAPIGRPQVRRLLAQQASETDEAQTINLSNPDEAVEIGTALDAPVVMTINVPYFGETISISASLINVEDQTTLWIAHESGRGSKSEGLFGLGVSRGSEDDLLSAPPIERSSNGMPLSPEQAENIQVIIKNLCSSLPEKITSAEEIDW